MKRNLIILVIIIVLLGGGMYVYEQGRNTERQEIQNEQLRQQQEAERKQKIEQLKNELADAKAQFTMANNELNDINSFHLLRSASEKERQLSDQYKKIDKIKERIKNINEQLSQLQY
ncbi:MAG TPA: hypothetical protein VI757_13220 [Bacteroidia bacterium]|nr:hypothetical protein [Bacteroidia bacterium]